MSKELPRNIPEETYQSLVEATLQALLKHGYSNLTVRDIDDEWEMSRQLINYHFDGKDDLLATILFDLIETAAASLPDDTNEDPVAQLEHYIASLLSEPQEEELRFWEFLTAMYEMQFQSRHRPKFRETFSNLEDEVAADLERTVAEGIELGRFTAAEPNEVAALIDNAIVGAHVKKIYLGKDSAPENTKRALQFVVEELLLTGD